MRDTKGMPQYDICVVDVLVAVLLHPFRETFGWIARSLGDVSAGRVSLVVLVYLEVSLCGKIVRRLE